MLGKMRSVLSVAAIAAIGVPAAAFNDDPVSIEHDMSKCAEGSSGASVLVRVEDFKDLEGNVRAQIYGSNPDEFLEKGKKLVRVDVPTEGDGQEVCVPLPAPGTYALVILHDRNSNGKADFFSEGFGFSNNPKLSLGPPDAREVMFDAADGPTRMTVTLSYIFGADEEQKEKRRQLRRR